MNLVDNARKFRKEFDAQRTATQKLLRADTIPAEELLELIDLFTEWKAGVKLADGDRVKYNGKLYQVLPSKGHTTQADWKPNEQPSIFKEIVPDNIIREIPKVITAEQKFNKYELGTWKGKVYKSKIENNVWNPEQYSAGWELVE